MSNSLAIAAVTATLRNLLNRVAQPLPLDPDSDPDLADTVCTTRPPDKARTAEDRNQLNLFLYQTAPNAALRNMDLPRQVRPGETSIPPVAINLYYLLTAYGRNFDDILSHRLLGRAMSLINDNSPLLPADIAAALSNNDLGQQPERLRVTPHTLNAEEIGKLWTTFQTPYRISAAYEVSVVLLQSNRPVKAPLPVVSRSSDGQGPRVAPNLLSPFPTLTSVSFGAPAQPAARLPATVSLPGPTHDEPGDTLVFSGHDLGATSVQLAFQHPLMQAPLTVPPSSPTAAGFSFTLPKQPDKWPAGLYSVWAELDRGQPKPLTTNTLVVPLAPRICNVSPTTAARDGSGNVTLTVTVSPQVWTAQRASLLVGSMEFVSRPHSGGATDTLTFVCGGLGPGKYSLRLRVDGVDSFLVLYDDPVPAYDPNMSVTVT